MWFGRNHVVFLIIMSIGRWSTHNVSGTRRARGASTTGLRPFLSTLACRFQTPFSFVEFEIVGRRGPNVGTLLLI